MTARPFFSVIIPACDEEDSIAGTVEALVQAFAEERIEDYEIVVVDDHSRDQTGSVLARLAAAHPGVRPVTNSGVGGFGHAVRCGLAQYTGECVAIVMGDLSDAPSDVVAYYRALRDGAECVFGSRFLPQSRVHDYPRHKWLLNRMANTFIRLLFRIPHNDITNAFKAYRREVIEGIQPLLSSHFNLTVEMPLKAIIRGYRYVTLPISWTNRKAGISKLKIREMGSRYLFIVLYCWLEKKLARQDYHRHTQTRDAAGEQTS